MITIKYTDEYGYISKLARRYPENFLEYSISDGRSVDILKDFEFVGEFPSYFYTTCHFINCDLRKMFMGHKFVHCIFEDCLIPEHIELNEHSRIIMHGLEW